jgi:hypothetical protein
MNDAAYDELEFPIGYILITVSIFIIGALLSYFVIIRKE